MQKQHLHIVLLVFGCHVLAGCGESKFGELNPYLHGKQELNFAIPDTNLVYFLISGWEFLPVASFGSVAGDIKIVTPDGHKLGLDWLPSDSEEPVQFSGRVRHVRGMTVRNQALGLTCSLSVADDGRSLAVTLLGATVTPLDARFAVDVAGVKSRGLAAMTETWSATQEGSEIALPWGDRWKLLTEGEVVPLPKTASDISAKMSFEKSKRLSYTVQWSPLSSLRGERGLDIDTESNSADRALALLIASVPPVHALLPTEDYAFERAADLSLAQWLVHAEFAPSYLSELSVTEDQTFLLKYGVSAYWALYSWGCLPKKNVLEREPLLDAAMSRIDTTSQEIQRGASLEERFREATVWTFAEENLATDRPEQRKVYREQAHIALKDAQSELKERFRLWRDERAEQSPDTVELYELYIGGDSAIAHDDAAFLQPDTQAVLRIVGRGNLSWLNVVNVAWLEAPGLPWPLVMDRLRWQFASSVRVRTSNHWEIAEAALLDPEHPGILSEARFGAPPVASAAAEVETIVQSYLGIQPHWRERSITFDARLPQNWGRTRARIPFEDGELYVDYDFANNQAWLAANGLTQSYTCQFYMPTPSGSLSGQFKLAPGDAPRKITLFVDSGNVYRLRFESDGLPE